MGLGRNARFQLHRYGRQNRILVVLQDQRQDLDHFPVTAQRTQKLLLKPPEAVWQLQERRTIAQRSRLSNALSSAFRGMKFIVLMLLIKRVWTKLQSFRL